SREVESWDRGPVVMRLPKENAQEFFQEKQGALARISDDLEWRQTEQTPAYQAWEREQERIDRAIDIVTSPEYLGQQAEERFYAEQGPMSQWYREDLYHGQAGPDVARDIAEFYAREQQELDPAIAAERAEWQAIAAEFNRGLTEDLEHATREPHPDDGLTPQLRETVPLHGDKLHVSSEGTVLWLAQAE